MPIHHHHHLHQAGTNPSPFVISGSLSPLQKFMITAVIMVFIALLFPAISQAKQQSDPLKHCLAKVEIKTHEVYLKKDWRIKAQQKSTLKWQKSVQARYGSVYSKWDLSQNKKTNCTRIGFGNDKEGNIGTTVNCFYAAEPCVLLITKSKK